MSTDSRGYWREEFSLIAILLLFFFGIVAFSYHLPFDARLFPIVIGSAGILLTLGIAIEQAVKINSPIGCNVHEAIAIEIGKIYLARGCSGSMIIS